jgi:predicted small metal-binding protein
MKTIKCSQVGGGECAFTATGSTQDEVKGLLSAHAKEAHAEMVAAATPESMEEWGKMYAGVWESAPDNA